jgi:hypothetical protein
LISDIDRTEIIEHDIKETGTTTTLVQLTKSKKRIRHEDERWKDDIISRAVQLQKELGGCSPGLLDLYCAGFESEEINAVWDDLMLLYPDFDTKGSVNIEALQNELALQSRCDNKKEVIEVD